MSRKTIAARRGYPCRTQAVSFVAVAVIGAALAAIASERESITVPQPDSPGSAARTPLAESRAPRIEGHEKCVDCHRAEYRRWLDTHHANESFDMLRNRQESIGYAEKLNIDPHAITKAGSLCTNCHATPQRDHQGRSRVIAGISCEACHGASGGAHGWLNIHAVYGPPGSRREDESAEHLQMRQQRCDQAGMISTKNPYALARGCYQCHIVWHEDLVNEAGHPATTSAGFEFVTWATGEVRHNFHVDQTTNRLTSTLRVEPGGDTAPRLRLMYVSGQFAKLNVGLTNLAHARDSGDTFAAAMTTEIDSAVAALNQVREHWAPNGDSTFARKLDSSERARSMAEILADVQGQWNGTGIKTTVEAYWAAGEPAEKQAALEDLRSAVADSAEVVAATKTTAEIVDSIKNIRASFADGDVVRAANDAFDSIDPVANDLSDLELSLFELIDDFVADHEDAKGDTDEQEDLLADFREDFELDAKTIEVAIPVFAEAYPLLDRAFKRMDAETMGDAYVRSVAAADAEIESILTVMRGKRLQHAAAEVDLAAAAFLRDYDGSAIENVDQILEGIQTDRENNARYSDEFKERSGMNYELNLP